MKKNVLSVLIIFLLLLTSCKAKKAERIVFDNSEPLALSPDISWALITDPYAAFKKEMSWDSEDNGHCRRGEILRVLGKSVDKQKYEWYKFEQGWLPSNCLSVYSNKLKAKNAAKSLKE